MQVITHGHFWRGREGQPSRHNSFCVWRHCVWPVYGQLRRSSRADASTGKALSLEVGAVLATDATVARASYAGLLVRVAI